MHAHAVERSLHERYAKTKTVGEWFSLKKQHLLELEAMAANDERAIA
jgi:hypothetical protein